MIVVIVRTSFHNASRSYAHPRLAQGERSPLHSTAVARTTAIGGRSYGAGLSAPGWPGVNLGTQLPLHPSPTQKLLFNVRPQICTGRFIVLHSRRSVLRGETIFRVRLRPGHSHQTRTTTQIDCTGEGRKRRGTVNKRGLRPANQYCTKIGERSATRT